MANSGLIQGMDTIPIEVLKKYGDFIADYLPGWTPDRKGDASLLAR
jgi:hypothetical protein